MSDSRSTVHVIDSDRHQTSKSPTTANDNNCVTSEEIKSGFGYLRFRPARLQFLTSIRWFMLFMCMAIFCLTMVNGLPGLTVSTLERRFSLSSSQAAWIPAAYEIAGTPALVIGYFGSNLRRPLWIGGGIFLYGVSVGIYMIPHFAAPAYQYADSTDSGNLCVDDNSKVSESGKSSADSRCSDEEVSDGSKYLAVFVVSMVLQGFGALSRRIDQRLFT